MFHSVPFSYLGMRMHACLLKGYKEIATEDTGHSEDLKLCIYTYIASLHFTAYVIIGESRKSCLFNKAKARKECSTLIPIKTKVEIK